MSEIAGLMGPLGMPAAVLGGAMKALNPDDLMELHGLLGKGIALGKKVVRLSSGNPATDEAIVHTADGERIKTSLRHFLDTWRTIGQDIPEEFPEGRVISRPGVPAPSAEFGPQGGLVKRQLPPVR